MMILEDVYLVDENTQVLEGKLQRWRDILAIKSNGLKILKYSEDGIIEL